MSKYEEIRVSGKRHLKHRYVWEQHNGRIPKGYEIHHKDGDTHNNDIENLEMLSIHDHRSIHAKNQTGRKLTPETKLKIAKSHTGKRHTEETKLKMSKSYSRKRKIMCVETGDIFDTIEEASQKFNRDRKGFYNCLNGTQNTVCGFHFKELITGGERK